MLELQLSSELKQFLLAIYYFNNTKDPSLRALSYWFVFFFFSIGNISFPRMKTMQEDGSKEINNRHLS